MPTACSAASRATSGPLPCPLSGDRPLPRRASRLAGRRARPRVRGLCRGMAPRPGVAVARQPCPCVALPRGGEHGRRRAEEATARATPARRRDRRPRRRRHAARAERRAAVAPAEHQLVGARWLGPSYAGNRARVALVRLTGGSALRIAYGPLVVWNYRKVVPSAVLQLRGGVAKVFPIPGGIVTRRSPRTAASSRTRRSPTATQWWSARSAGRSTRSGSCNTSSARRKMAREGGGR
jgi:hypothetical protein